ncbi:uncharacterized protein LOC141852388 [Brevipalpus obovatus]|uniref:uncharacterized protein LOC141852388 n=1 Tax=Brevipalpus obovatus TaxID=246614 RepID=UPI003D9E5549
MNQVNCLFSFEEISHRLVIETSNPDRLIDYDEFRKALEENPKLKDHDLFNEQKYVLEIFDKGFEEFVKLSKDVKIPDYTKIRSRLRPKSTLIPKTSDTAAKSSDSIKRPLSMYKENLLEDGQVNKMAKKSPNEPAVVDPAGDASAEPVVILDSPDESSSMGIPKNSSSSSSTTTTTTTTSLSSLKPQNSPPCYSIDSSRAPPPTSTSTVSSKSPKIGSTSSPSCRPEPMDSLSSRESCKKNTESDDNQKEKKGNGIHLTEKSSLSAILSPSSSNARIEALKDQFAVSNVADKYILVKLIIKYNEEFENISIIDDIWETENIWNYVWREMQAQNVREIRNLKSARQAFRTLVKTYAELLTHTELPSREAQEVWPFFDSFHNQLNLKPFDQKISKLKEAFDKSEKRSTNSSSSMKVTSELPFTMDQAVKVTSDDFKLLLAMEDHNKEFTNEYIPEYNAWREVTDQMHLFKPFDSSEIIKCKNRFYELLREFLKIDKASCSEEEKQNWQLYGSFKNLDLKPFLAKL